MAIPYAFVILSATSAVYILSSAINYLGFYPAVGQVTLSISRIAFETQHSSNGGQLLATVNVGNPTDYSGLKIAELVLATYFLPSNSSNPPLFQGLQPTGSEFYFTPLPPHTQISLNITTTLDPAQASSLSYYLNLNSYKITASSSLGIQMSTFLDTAVGYINAPGVQQKIPLAVTA